MMAQRSQTLSLGLASAALLLGVVAACSGTVDEPLPGAGGEANAAGAAAEPASAGSVSAPAEPSAGGAGTNVTAGGDGNVGAGAASHEGGATAEGGAGGAAAEIPTMPAYASRIESFEAGPGAGFNQDKLPDIVLGAPQGKGTGSGTYDVLSLGAGGEIVLGFGDLAIVDGPGPDLVVFENAFWPGGDAATVFAELGEVSVSEDGETWHTFPCDSTGDGEGHFAGCAGFTPTLVYDAATLVPLDPALSGGDAFDLADVGLDSVRFVKIRDLETQPLGGNTTGFDLDAVGAIHAR
jgi:hypothetical protein